ncbi:MAG: hypothetical protein HY332_20175 [Chloroflexi bacterium]|nr:hypothetical protein [Chloroflexota bacterium]
MLRAALTAIDDPDVRSTDRTTGGHVELSVLTPAVNDGLTDLLLRLGIPNCLGYQGMIKIIDAPGLFAALGLDAVDIAPRDDGWRLHHEGTTLDVTEAELVKLVFGPERRLDFAPDLFPVTFFQWPFDRV